MFVKNRGIVYFFKVLNKKSVLNFIYYYKRFCRNERDESVVLESSVDIFQLTVNKRCTYKQISLRVGVCSAIHLSQAYVIGKMRIPLLMHM